MDPKSTGAAVAGAIGLCKASRGTFCVVAFGGGPIVCNPSPGSAEDVAANSTGGPLASDMPTLYQAGHRRQCRFRRSPNAQSRVVLFGVFLVLLIGVSLFLLLIDVFLFLLIHIVLIVVVPIIAVDVDIVRAVAFSVVVVGVGILI